MLSGVNVARACALDMLTCVPIAYMRAGMRMMRARVYHVMIGCDTSHVRACVVCVCTMFPCLRICIQYVYACTRESEHLCICDKFACASPANYRMSMCK